MDIRKYLKNFLNYRYLLFELVKKNIKLPYFFLFCIDNAHILWYNEYTKHEEVILWQQLI